MPGRLSAVGAVRVECGCVRGAGLSLSWSPSRDDLGVVGYTVYVGGTQVGTTAGASYAVGGLACGQTYGVSVDAVDAAGNHSAQASASAATAACVSSPGSWVSCDRVASPSGSDSNPGTPAAPFATPQKLADSLTAGQTGCLRGGTYTTSGSYILNVSTGGSSSAPLTIRGYPGDTATLVGIVQVRNGADDVVLSNLHIHGDGMGGNNTIKIYAADDIVQDSDITNNWLGRSCMMLGSSSAGQAVRTIVRRNKFHECGNPVNGELDHAIYAGDITDGQIVDNLFWDSAAYAIQLYPNAQNTIFAHNVVDGDSPSVRGGVIFGGDGSSASSHNTVEQNVIAYAQTYDITSWWGGAVGSGNIARNNCVYAGRSGDISGNGFSASANLSANPLFVNKAAHDYRLQAASPCLVLVGYDTAAKLVNQG